MSSIMNTVSPIKSQALSLPGDALAADANGRPVLIGCVCKSCGNRMFPFAPVCPVCMSEDMAREAMPRAGTLYSLTVLHVGPKTWAKPFAVGYVDLSNGVRVFSHLRGARLEIGQPVELATAEVGKNAEGAAITTFVFQPAKA
jgi:uncharacterized OB-fold protein